MKNRLWFLLLLASVLFASCEKEEPFRFELGEIQRGLKLDTVYFAETSGFLYVELDAMSSATFFLVLADQEPEPQTEVARLAEDGALYVPMNGGTYWKVEGHNSNWEQPTYKRAAITWTPVK